MVKLLTSVARDSDAQRLFSILCWSESKCPVSMKSHINQFLSATLISEKNCTTISLWAVEQPCSQASQRDLARKWQLWPHQQWRSRCSLLKRENSWYGLVDQSWRHCRLSMSCGSLRPNIKNKVQMSCTESVSVLSVLSVVPDSNRNLLFLCWIWFDFGIKYLFDFTFKLINEWILR